MRRDSSMYALCWVHVMSTNDKYKARWVVKRQTLYASRTQDRGIIYHAWSTVTLNTTGTNVLLEESCPFYFAPYNHHFHLMKLYRAHAILCSQQYGCDIQVNNNVHGSHQAISCVASPTSTTNFVECPATFSSCSKTEGSFAIIEWHVTCLFKLSHSKSNRKEFISSLMTPSALTRSEASSSSMLPRGPKQLSWLVTLALIRALRVERIELYCACTPKACPHIWT